MDTTSTQQFPYQQPVQDQADPSIDPAMVQQPPSVQDSYADAYVPPAGVQTDSVEPSSYEQPATPEPPAAAPEQSPAADTEPVATAPEGPSESLADQNIFEMLGVTTGTPEQREQFLDELQQVIWEDFIEHDVKLLLTDSEQAELQTIMQGTTDKSLEQQEQVVVFLEKLIPDLEEIMLEKALQLKEEMARERLNALRELHRNDTEKMTKIEQAEQLMSQQQWRTASESLNTLG